MTPVRWIFVCLVCVGVYFIPGHLPEWEGAYWFAGQSLWSVGCVWLILEICHSRLVQIVAGIELLAIIWNGIAVFEYLSGGGPAYEHYETVMTGLALVQALVLFLGAPWRGLRTLVSHAGHRVSSRISRIANRVRGA